MDIGYKAAAPALVSKFMINYLDSPLGNDNFGEANHSM